MFIVQPVWNFKSLHFEPTGMLHKFGALFWNLLMYFTQKFLNRQHHLVCPWI
jgi:hypothetical protein